MRLVLTASFLALGACASVKPAPVDPYVNVTEDARAVAAAVETARAGELGLIAPADIESARVHARRAADQRRDMGRRDDILRELGLAHAYLDRAHARGEAREVEMDEVFAQRRAAVAVGADTLEATRGAFAKLDQQIRDSYPTSERRRERLTDAYRTLEVAGVEARELGSARAQLLDARRLRAEFIAPKALAAAEGAYLNAAAVIDRDPRAPDAYRAPVETAGNLARALVAITQQARAVATRSDEDLAREMLLNRQRVEELAGEVANFERREFNAVLARARHSLAKTDAEVYPAGDRLLIRLKSGGKPTLQSVKGVLKDLEARDVFVQGGSTAQAAEVAKSLAEVTPVFRTVDGGAGESAPVEVVLTPRALTR